MCVSTAVTRLHALYIIGNKVKAGRGIVGFLREYFRYCSVKYQQSIINFLVYNSNKMHKSQSLFYLTTALHVSGVTITHLQEHKTTVTTASGNRYTVIDRNKFTDKEYR